MTSLLGRVRQLLQGEDAHDMEKGPLGLHLKAGFQLNTLDIRLAGDKFLIELPGDDYTVAATSHIYTGAGSDIYRYYTSGDEFLQINTTGGISDACIEDIKFFAYIESFNISSRDAWKNAISPSAMGLPVMSWGDKKWERVFNPLERHNVEPVCLLEEVENSEREKWEVNNFCMLYQRNIDETAFEYLLISGEETFNEQQEPEWLVSWSLGVDISRSGLQVVG